jgi:transposase
VLGLTGRARVFIAPEATDLHLSFDRLAGLVRHRLRGDPLSGDVFAFFNRPRTTVKILQFDGSGFSIHHRRLEEGTFQLPTVPAGATRVEVDAATLGMILEGVDLRAPRRRRYRHDASQNRAPQS